MNTKDYTHTRISFIHAFCCAVSAIIDGADFREAFAHSFEARKIANALYALGITVEDIEKEMEEKEWNQ